MKYNRLIVSISVILMDCDETTKYNEIDMTLLESYLFSQAPTTEAQPLGMQCSPLNLEK